MNADTNTTDTAVVNYGLPTTIITGSNGKEKPYIVDDIVKNYLAKQGTNAVGPQNIAPGVQHIYCTKTHKRVTCYGGNLLGKIAKAGGIHNLLTTFVSKDAGGVTMKATGTTTTVDVDGLKAELEALKAENLKLKGTPIAQVTVIEDETLALEPGKSELSLDVSTSGQLVLADGSDEEEDEQDKE